MPNITLSNHHVLTFARRFSYSPNNLADQHPLMSSNSAESISDPQSQIQTYAQHELNVGQLDQQPTCVACGAPILDRYLLKVCDSLWHEQCLACSICDVRLAQSPSCYVRDGKIFCKIDYKR